MDAKHENMQFLGIFGILQEAFKIIYTGRRIFTQITLSLILPLSFLSFTYLTIINSFLESTRNFQKLSEFASSEIIYFQLFNLAFSILLAILSLVACSAVVYAAACIYTGYDVTFKQVMSVVPKVWKRLLITYLCIMAVTSAFIFLTILLLLLIVGVIYIKYGNQMFSPGIVIIIFLFLFVYFLAAFYMSIIWQLSYIVSALEDLKGFKAMAKSKALLKGKMRMARSIFICVSFLNGAVILVFQYLVLKSVSLGLLIKVVLGIVCFLSYPLFFLLMYTTETVLYFVCKSYHNENIEKPGFSNYLQVDQMGEYGPLKAGDIQDIKFQIV